MDSWSPEAALAAAQPPASLSQLALTALPPRNIGSRPAFAVEFSVSCKTCNHAVFLISGFPKIAPDPSPYYGLPPGKTFWRPPHNLKCLNCGSVAKLFDARTDGYDGICNGGCSYESGTDGETFVPGSFKVTVTPVYNIELSEIIESAAAFGVQTPDLFDSFVIHGDPVGGGKRFETHYECA
ncbi:MAG TPA: hypothetical protein VMF67_15670 [Rhizomicrobium sp.]|nr:hypothetical protein [Rhizomicrobium sp.]